MSQQFCPRLEPLLQAHMKDNARDKRVREERTRARGKSAIVPFLHPF